MSTSSQSDQPEKFSILSLFPSLVGGLSRCSSAEYPDHEDAVDNATEMLRCLLIASKRFSINARFLDTTIEHFRVASDAVKMKAHKGPDGVAMVSQNVQLYTEGDVESIQEFCGTWIEYELQRLRQVPSSSQAEEVDKWNAATEELFGQVRPELVEGRGKRKKLAQASDWMEWTRVVEDSGGAESAVRDLTSLCESAKAQGHETLVQVLRTQESLLKRDLGTARGVW